MAVSIVNIVLLDLSLLSVLTVIGFVLMSFVLQVEAQECKIGDIPDNYNPLAELGF
jgi:hypothetical protein